MDDTKTQYLVTVIFYYIFHIKPQFFKALFHCSILMKVLPIEAIILKYFLEAQILNIRDLNANLNYLSSNVLSLYGIFDVQNLVLCLTREPLKFVDYKIMLRKIHLILPLLVNKSSKSNKSRLCNNVLQKCGFI